ncbi:MAG: MFS transporter [Gemmataceae bacterium]|nr:MFS transporter [Gemmataceae bacterium]
MEQSERPTKARFILLGFLCALAFVLYLDRICIAQAAKPIQADLNISDTQWGFVLAAFTIAYALFEVPTGRMGDRDGARKVLTRIVLWWSAFTALTGASTGLVTMLTARFLFGAGEAGAYPNAARVISRWFSVGERGRVQGTMLAFSLLGGAVAPSLAQVCINNFGWRYTFVMFGLAGVFWAASFYYWFLDAPSEHPAVNKEELEQIGTQGMGTTHAPIPWKLIFHSKNLYLLVSILICTNFTSYIFFGWFPKYLQDGRGVEKDPSSWMASLLLGSGALGMILGGRINDKLYSQGNARQRRGLIVMTITASCLACSTFIDNAWAATATIAFGYFIMNQMLPVWWATTIEVTGKHVGSIFGLLNGVAGLIGAVSTQVLFGLYSDYRKGQGFTGRDQFDPFFLLCSGILLIAGVCWWFVNPAKKLESEEPSPGIKEQT